MNVVKFESRVPYGRRMASTTRTLYLQPSEEVGEGVFILLFISPPLGFGYITGQHFLQQGLHPAWSIIIGIAAALVLSSSMIYVAYKLRGLVVGLFYAVPLSIAVYFEYDLPWAILAFVAGWLVTAFVAFVVKQAFAQEGWWRVW